MDDIVAIGSNGTAVNTSSTGGVNRLLRVKIESAITLVYMSTAC